MGSQVLLAAKYSLVPVTVKITHPPLLKNGEQILEILLGLCPKIFPSLITATVYLSQGMDWPALLHRDVVLQQLLCSLSHSMAFHIGQNL